ncbi:TraR/DksA C4-type zinc finger protein [Salibacterium halotolerans]|uniref:RNA polymerase-binding protein DksA n=1 Tax=Salibacterium halotolerans TaxID=1884432 RepID=A0A1I5VBD7_9BACI|nr:TraR/DksA C4-type zinc finger protein [Salibacterium halotolerans]SFQ04722.1 RNA polymerase-binding protein DksA [Salibacterium halotolerans]
MKTSEFFQKMQKRLLEELKQHAEHDKQETAFAQETVGELSNYDNHPADTASGLYEREKDMALEQHEERSLDRVKKALQAIEEGTYGTCEICGADIPVERLEAEPTALCCMQHAGEESGRQDRPVEEERLIPGKGGFTGMDMDETANGRFDAEETWDLTAAYGTSDTPQDMNDPEEAYDGLFGSDLEENGAGEVPEGFSITDSEGRPVDVDRDVDFSNMYLRR